MFPAEKYFAGANTAVGRSGAYRLRSSRTDTAQYRQADKGNLGALDRHIDVALRLMSQRYKFTACSSWPPSITCKMGEPQ